MSVKELSKTISKQGKNRQWRLALSTLHGALPSYPQTALPVVPVNAALSALKASSQWEQAVALFQSLQSRSLRADPYTYATLVVACNRGQRWQASLSFFEESLNHGKESLVGITAAISSHEFSRRWSEALSLLSSPKTKRAGGPDDMMIGAALSVLERSSQWQPALSLLAAQDRPNVVMYNSVLSACEKSSRWRHALALFRSAQRNNLKIDVVMGSALVSAFEKSQLWERALETVRTLRSSHIALDVAILSAAIGCCDRAGRWEEAIGFFQEASKTRHGANLVAHNCMLSALATAQKWEVAAELLVKMLDTGGVGASVASLTSTLEALARAAQWQRSIWLLDVAAGAASPLPTSSVVSKSWSKPDPASLPTNITAAVGHLPAALARDTWAAAVAKPALSKITPNLLTWGAAAAGAERGGSYGMCLWTQKMQLAERRRVARQSDAKSSTFEQTFGAWYEDSGLLQWVSARGVELLLTSSSSSTTSGLQSEGPAQECRKRPFGLATAAQTAQKNGTYRSSSLQVLKSLDNKRVAELELGLVRCSCEGLKLVGSWTGRFQ